MAYPTSFQKRRITRRPYARPARGRAGISRSLSRFYGIAALAAAVCIGVASSGVLPSFDQIRHDPFDSIVSLWNPAPELVTSRPFPICSSGARVDCIVDGDTFWIGGQKVRIADINTPEISSPKCRHERALGEKAKRRLHQLMNAGPIELHRSGNRDRDVYGRLLRTVHRGGRSLGDTLVAEGLAHRWRGHQESWCG